MIYLLISGSPTPSQHPYDLSTYFWISYSFTTPLWFIYLFLDLLLLNTPMIYLPISGSPTPQHPYDLSTYFWISYSSTPLWFIYLFLDLLLLNTPMIYLPISGSQKLVVKWQTVQNKPDALIRIYTFAQACLCVNLERVRTVEWLVLDWCTRLRVWILLETIQLITV